MTHHRAVVFTVISHAGIDECRIPGKSGAITVNFDPSAGNIGFPIREVSANPCSNITADRCALMAAPSLNAPVAMMFVVQ